MSIVNTGPFINRDRTILLLVVPRIEVLPFHIVKADKGREGQAEKARQRRKGREGQAEKARQRRPGS